MSPGGWVRGGRRVRELARPTDQSPVDHLRAAPVRHPDETGRRVGGRSAWLWVFAGAAVTVYRVRPGRGHDGAVEVLGAETTGVPVTGGVPAYDPLGCDEPTCLAHRWGTCSEVEAGKTRGAVRFSRRVAARLRRAMALRRRRGEMSAHGSATGCGPVEAALDRLGPGGRPGQRPAGQAAPDAPGEPVPVPVPGRGGRDQQPGRAGGPPGGDRPQAVGREPDRRGGRRARGPGPRAADLSAAGRAILQSLTDLLRHGPGHVLDLLGPSPQPAR